MATAGKDRDTRESRERSRVYQARQTFHDEQIRRRTRDNVIAGVGGGLVIAAIIVVQTLFFTVGPGTPAPEPTSTPAPTDSMSPAPTPVVSEPAPDESTPVEPSPESTQ